MTRTDKTAIFLAERLEPLTAAEHAQENGLEAEYARDVARTCTCIFQWDASSRHYTRIADGPDCPWNKPGNLT
jgi:hypothetical protein